MRVCVYGGGGVVTLFVLWLLVLSLYLLCVCGGGECCDLVCAVALGVKPLFIVRVCVWAGCVGTLFCVVALGVMTIFIVCVCGRVVLGPCFVLWLLV